MATDRRIVRSIRRVPTTVKQYGSAPSVLEMPHLIEMPRQAYDRFLRDGLQELFAEISPITDFTGTRMELVIGTPSADGRPGYRLDEPKHNERECRQRDMTYSVRLMVRSELKILETGEKIGRAHV